MKRWLLLIVACATWVHAELPPSAYEQMQAKAGEEVTIQVLRVDVAPGAESDTQQVEATAMVEKVARSVSGLRSGDLIRILYSIRSHPEGWVGPGEIPLLTDRQTTVAFLTKSAEQQTYTPAAGVMSFRKF